MRIFKNRWFDRFARDLNISEPRLCQAIADAERGLIDADLGGGVIKQRVAREGQGKSGGFRTVILYKRGSRAFFVYGFAKSERANISSGELAAFRNLASIVFAYGERELAPALAAGALVEMHCDEEESTKKEDG